MLRETAIDPDQLDYRAALRDLANSTRVTLNGSPARVVNNILTRFAILQTQDGDLTHSVTWGNLENVIRYHKGRFYK